jgi:hypothetical protein
MNITIISIIISYFFILTTTLLHYSFSDISARKQQIHSFTQLSKLPNISKSVGYLEPRFKEYEDYSTKIYPKLNKINYLGLVYE